MYVLYAITWRSEHLLLSVLRGPSNFSHGASCQYCANEDDEEASEDFYLNLGKRKQSESLDSMFEANGQVSVQKNEQQLKLL